MPTEPFNLLRFVTAAMLLLAPVPAAARESGWVASWAASPQPVWDAAFPLPVRIPATVRATTFRQIARISLGGKRLRLTFSNTYGRLPLRLGAASVGIAGTAATEATAIRRVTFAGQAGVVIAPGASIVSDPVDLPVRALARLAVSTYLPDPTRLATFHWDARATGWFGDGDVTRDARFAPTGTTEARILLTGVQVDTANAGAVVAIGDSITDGDGARIDADVRWPDFLAARLASRGVAVVNAGILGNRLLSDGMGERVLARFDRDVLAQPGVRAVVVMIGINDIAWPGTAFAPRQARPGFAALIAGYRRLAAQAHARGVRIVAVTLTPFGGALAGTPLADYYAADKDALRQRINRWIRDGRTFDAVIDADALLCDPGAPSRIARTFDSGDHLHPGEAGNRALADAIDPAALLSRKPGRSGAATVPAATR